MSELRATRFLCTLAAAFVIFFGAEFLHQDAASACCGGAARPGEGTGGRPPTGRPPIVRPPTGNTGIEAARRAARDAAERARQQGRTGGSGSTDRRAGGTNARGTPPTFNQSIEQAIREGAGQNTNFNTVWTQVFGRAANGDAIGSCVDASHNRARDIANRIRQAIAAGELDLGGRTVTVGTRSAWNVPGTSASWHTYTLVEVKGPDGKTQGTWDVDTYVIPAVNVDGPDDMIPPSPAAWDPARRTDIGDTPLYEVKNTTPKPK